MRPCEHAFTTLKQLSPAQLFSCVKALPPGELHLNPLLYLLGETGDSRYVTTLAPFLAQPAHHGAALAALGKLMTASQLGLLEPYLKEDVALKQMLAVLQRQPDQIDPGRRAWLGQALLKELPAMATEEISSRQVLVI